MTKQEDVQNSIPAGRLFLERPRIDRLLEKALQSHAVTVMAGEGYGKTYAVNAFLQTDSRPIIWVQLSERDNLTWRFWENYTGEIARLNPKAAKIFAKIGFPETGRQLDQYLTLVKNEIVSHERYVIVFDDFHLITNPTILKYLDRVLAVPVSKNPIVLISRAEPGINTLGLLAKGLLSQITVEDLRFTEEEIGDYFRLNDMPLETGDISRIYRDTEGWALAVDLVVREIKAGYTKGETPGWDRIMKPVRNIEEEIFSGMGRNLQKFLIKLSLIEHWPRSLLEILDPGEENISAMGQFTSLVRFDTYLHGFRIHAFFLDFLREKQGELSPEEIREVYTRDAQWCIENNLSIDAAVNYERARDYGGLLRVIYTLPPLLSNPMASFFLEILNRLIPEIGDDEENGDRLFLWFIIRPRLLMFLGRFEEASGELRKAISLFENRPPGPWRSSSLTLAYCSLGTLAILSCRYTKDYNFAPWFERGYHYYLEDPEA
ncbi:MAG: helix-turn-helix transcriptional regulator, partial [Treponema sp.]|nr:helix-turn-helix transcriptional regulator [Treponema sp.]